MMEAQQLFSRVNGAFLQTCLYAMRETKLKMMTADGQSIGYQDGAYYIGEGRVHAHTAMKAIEHYYEHDPEALEEDSGFIRKRVMKHRRGLR